MNENNQPCLFTDADWQTGSEDDNLPDVLEVLSALDETRQLQRQLAAERDALRPHLRLVPPPSRSRVYPPPGGNRRLVEKRQAG